MITINKYVQNPSSNSPGSASYEQNSTASISWILTDNYEGGFYRVLRNESEYISWTPWTSGSNLNVPIDTSIIGVWSYTILYNDSLGNWGIPNLVYISINTTINDNIPSSPPTVDGYNPFILIGTIMMFFIIIENRISSKRKK